jgi:hypothetical protein
MSNPRRLPPARDFGPGRLRQRKKHLVAELGGFDQAERRRRRKRVLVLFPAVVLLLAATGFTTYALTREPTHLASIGCFETESLDVGVAVVDADGRDPRTICAELWRTGALPGPIPNRLEACVLEEGVGVFPSSSPGTCSRLGLADLPASYAAQARRFAELRNAIFARIGWPGSGTDPGSGRCAREEEARTVVREELDDHGYTEWRIEVDEGFTSQQPCASLAFDEKRKIVVLVPMAP